MLPVHLRSQQFMPAAGAWRQLRVSFRNAYCLPQQTPMLHAEYHNAGLQTVFTDPV